MHYAITNFKKTEIHYKTLYSDEDSVRTIDPEIKPYILRKKWHPSQQEAALKDKRLEVRFTVNGCEDIKQWLYRWIPYVEVVGPKELREEIKRDLKAEMQKHDKH